MEKKGKVLLTGVSGFLGAHTTIQLLEKNYEVLGTLRDLSRSASVKEIIAAHTDKVHRLSFAQADLLDKQAWHTLTQGVDFVQHIASPFPRVLPKNDDELVAPAREGTLSILEGASANGVKRVVLTSSLGAIVYGKAKGHKSGPFTEADWNDANNKKDSTPYFRSKAIAEKAAWDFIKKDDSGMTLSTVCPGAILGPVLEQDFGNSANLVIKMLDGSSPALPDIGFDIVDVRSVADLLIRAMERPEAANERFIATAGYHKAREVAQILKQAYPDKKIPSLTLPHFMVRLYSNIDTTIKPVLVDLGVIRQVDGAKAKNVLNWEPSSSREAILSCAKSVLDLGLA